MSSNKILVTYTSSPAFLSTDHWKQVHAALLCQFPLRTLHWKSPSRANIETIPQVDVNLVPLESLRDEHTSQIPQSLLDKPLLNVYFVVCDDNDTYKNTVRKQIRDWHASVSQRKHQEWLLVHIVRPDGKIGQGRMFQMKASVLDKIKADLNADKKDRCIQVAWSTDYENPAAWAELINKFKEGILSAFDSAFTQREEEVKRSEGQRHMPGWNFCTFFILKESLATSFEAMSLCEEALQHYNDLEASFFRVLREKNLTWFGALIAPGSEDDSTPLLSVSKKPYRDLILANSISIFDFRVYLLARQCALLSKLSRVIEVCRKAVAFLSGFGRRLRELEGTIPLFFVESWTYSSALSVVEQVDTWANDVKMGKPALARFSAVKGELLELAQQQLDIIGIRVGHLPSRPPFSIALPAPTPESTEAQEPPPGKISRTELLSAIDDKEAFFDLYVQIINRAIELYAAAGRRKFALKLHGNLAALDLVRQRLPNAFDTYKSLPAHYAPHGWSSLESFMRMQALTVHTSAEKARDEEWIHIVLDFLRTYVEDMGKELLMDVDDQLSYVVGLVTSLIEAARGLQADLLHPDHPALSLTIADKAVRLAESQDGALLDVIVRNRLPCDLSVDEVIAVLVGYEGAQLTFSTDATTLNPGNNKVTLFCSSSTAGVFALQASQVKISKLTFEWKDARLLTATKNLKLKDVPTLVRIPKDIRALDVRIRPPQRIEVGVPAKIMVALHTGRNDIVSAQIMLSSPSGVQFHFSEAKLDGDGSAQLEINEDALTVSSVEADSVVVISLPHSDASSYHTLRINAALEYTTVSEPDITRRLGFARFVATSLPMTVNVEDFFRGTRLFTRFTLSTSSHQHVRIRSAHLETSREDEDNVKVTGCHAQQPSVVTITPSQSGKFIFQLDSARGQAGDPLRLRITYRMLREEVESLIDVSMAAIVAETPHLLPHRDLLIDKVVDALSSDAKWIELYGITGELVVPDIVEEEGDIGDGLRRLNAILAKKRPGDYPFGEWREIIIPVDVPRMHILAAAHLRVTPNPWVSPQAKNAALPLFAGQPISAVVSVTTSFHWAPLEDEKPQGCLLRYDIEDMTGDWLVSGCKRSDFQAEDGSTFTMPVTLIALHHGELSLPKIAINALPTQGGPRMGSSSVPSCETYQMHGAEKVLVLPRGGRSTFVVDMGLELSRI